MNSVSALVNDFFMSAQNYEKIKEAFAAAAELEMPEREKFLAALDADSRPEVASLLAARDAAGDFLNDVSAVSVVRASYEQGDKFIGRTVDKYKIVREIGRGGMGVVFLAEREDFQQQVALKLIKRGMDSDAILDRFKREREILAALNHTNIARLLDGGTTADGAPFFVMEYVEGVSIDDYCAAKDLSEEKKLELFRKVCAAVSFAHQKLIVHRDLKPSNILVSGDGEPKLLDFGIAKLLNSADKDATQTRERVLTPAYASPEQMRGEIVSTASDVYSLGVILEELLTGQKTKQTPANKNWKSESGDGKSSGRTNPNSPLTTHLPRPIKGDLRNIVAKSLREDAARRYNSVERLSEDIRRYQVGLPITARKDSASYRAAKFVQRNFAAVVVAALFLLSLIGGLAATLWQAREARRERELAQARFDDARQMANSFLFEFHDSIENLPGATAAREMVVKRALEYLNKLALESGGNTGLERELGAAYERVGRIQGNSYYSNLGDTDGAIQSYNRSLEIRQKLAAQAPDDPSIQSELASGFEGVGDMRYTVNDLNAGLENYENARRIRENLAQSDAGNLEYLAALAAIESKIGDIKGLEGYPNLGDTSGALDAYKKAAAIDERLTTLGAPNDSLYKKNYAQRLSNFGMLLGTTGDAKAAAEAAEKADRLYSSLLAAEPNDAQLKLNRLSNNIVLRLALADDDRTAQAIEKANQTIAALLEMQAADPKDSSLARDLGVSYNALGRTLLQAGDVAGALAAEQKALATAEKLYAADGASAEKKQDLAHTLQFAGEARFAARDFSGALADYRRAVALLDDMKRDDASDFRRRDDLAVCYGDIGVALAATGETDAAAESLKRAIPLAEEAAEKSPVNARVKSRLARRYFELGKIYNQMRQTAEAKNWLQKSFDLWNGMKLSGTLNRVDARRLDEVSALLR